MHRSIWVGLLAATMIAAGCASTSNLANKATFGLVGSEPDPAEQERKAQEREAKRAAEEEERAQQEDRTLLSRATFGLAGGESEEEKAAKEAEKQAEREAKAQREAERKAAKAERDRLEREAKAQREAEKQAEKEARGDRTLLSRATFGLVGNESEEERLAKEQEEAAQRALEQQRQAEREAEEQAEREAKAAREAEDLAQNEQEEPGNGERSMLNRLTFGLAGAESEEERQAKEAEEAAKREEEERKRAERQAEKEREEAEKAKRSLLHRATFGMAGTESEEERQQREAEEAQRREEKRQAELAKAEEEANKTWLNKVTYGVLGEDYNDDALVAMLETNPEALTPEQVEKAENRKQEIANYQARQNVQSFSDPEARKLASYPFNTDVNNRTRPQGGAIVMAETETFSRAEYGIVDVGDVRIAVRGQTFKGDPRRSRLIAASTDRGPAQGSLGVGNQKLAYTYERGTTTATFGAVQFTLADSMLTVNGVTVPVGQGRKLIVLDGGGSPNTYDIDVESTTLGN